MELAPTLLRVPGDAVFGILDEHGPITAEDVEEVLIGSS
jgi:hypothetical protein